MENPFKKPQNQKEVDATVRLIKEARKRNLG
jgi:hypothetical protein